MARVIRAMLGMGSMFQPVHFDLGWHVRHDMVLVPAVGGMVCHRLHGVIQLLVPGVIHSMLRMVTGRDMVLMGLIGIHCYLVCLRIIHLAGTT